MPEVLLGVLGRDRPEGLRRCLASLERAGVPARVVIHLDGPEAEVREVAHSSGHQVLETGHQVGIGAALNRILLLREPGQHFCRVDGDTELVTEDWLAVLVDDLPKWPLVSTVLLDWEGKYTRIHRAMVPGDKVVPLAMGRGIGSVMLTRGDVVDRMGGFRLGKPYAFEDTDWYDRAKHLGVKAGADLRVLAQEAAPPVRKMWRRDGIQMEPAFAAARKDFFRETRPTFRPLVGRPPVMPGVGTDLSTSVEELSEVELAVAQTIAHGTHSEALAWAAGKAGPGAVLEVGSGYGSTPWLHGWCGATGRWLLTIETERPWFEVMAGLYSAQGHVVRLQPRGLVELPERFALALVDGINEDRAAWLAALAETEAVVVVHDTERTRDREMPGVAEALELFVHRRDFTAMYPHTTVVSNGVDL